MQLKHRQTALLLITICLLYLCGGPVFAQDEGLDTDKIIVRQKDPNKMTMKSLGDTTEKASRPEFFIVRPGLGQTLDELLEYYRNDPTVEYAEPNMKWTMQYQPNDPYYPQQWALPKINMPLAWETSRGNNDVIVAILDTGVDLNHPEFATKLIDGYNAITGEIGNSFTQDDQGHGTHLAGTICATVNNGIGISGIADHIKIMPVKVLDNKGSGWTVDIADGIMWAADHHAAVINLSLGADQSSKVLEDAVEYAHAMGVLLVAAAGNDGKLGVLYPAALPNVIGVTATDRNDQLSSISNFGAGIDLSAPGVNIYSTFWRNGVSGYESLRGTSMSTSFVSGVAALILSAYPGLTAAQVETALKESAVDLGVSGWDEEYGYGRIDASAALRYAKRTFIPEHYEAMCDINWDGFNNIEDLFLLSRHYGVANNESVYDLNRDGVIDIYDLIIIARQL